MLLIHSSEGHRVIYLKHKFNHIILPIKNLATEKYLLLISLSLTIMFRFLDHTTQGPF